MTFPNSEILGWKLTEDETYSGDLYFGGNTLDLNGHKLTVNGSLIQSAGTIFINGGQLEITGDYKLQTAKKDNYGRVTYECSNGYLKMINEADYVKVGGDFITQSQYSHNKLLSAGTIEVKGDFTQKKYSSYNNFRTSGTHKMLLSGSTLQTIYFDSPNSRYSCFNTLEITNSSASGVKFVTKAFVIKELKESTTRIINGENITLVSSAVINLDSWNYDLGLDGDRELQKDLTIGGNLYLNSGTLNLNGNKLTVEGSFIQASGTLNINEGQLNVNGDYRLQRESKDSDGTKTYSYSSGYLKMVKDADYVQVGGNFITVAYYSHESCLTAGTLEVKGDFIEKYYDYYGYKNFLATGTHKTILSGAGLQNVTFNSTESKFNILAVTKPINSGYIFSRTPLWNTLIEEPRDEIAPSAPTELLCTAKTAATVTLSWKESTDNVGVTGYDVYRDGVRAGSTTTTNYIDTGLIPNQTYVYTVKAYDIVRNQSDESNSISVTTDLDTIVPSTPQQLAITSKTEDSVSLTWTGSNDNVKVTGYAIYRNGEKVGSANGTSYTDIELSPNTYTYTVKAYDASNNLSEASNSVVFDNQAPSTPVLTLVSKTTTSVTLNWSESTDNIEVAGYELYRDDVKTKTLTATLTSYTDSGLLPNTTYSYYVKAYDASSNISEISNTITADTVIDTEAPTIPTNLAVGSATGKSITIVWKPSIDNVSVTGYTIYRDGDKVGTTSTASYTDEGLIANTTYTYKVEAYDAANNISAQSSELQAIPMIPCITRVVPQNGSTIGGTSYNVYVYFANSKNKDGSRVEIAYSTDENNWIPANITTYGPYESGTEIYHRCNWNLQEITAGTNESYFVKYTVYDKTNDKDEMTVTYLFDRKAPVAPQNMTALPSAGSIDLSWKAPADADVGSYKIYRSFSEEGSYILLKQINGKTNILYTDKIVETGQTYCYKVTAIDNFGQESEASNIATVTALDDTIPPVVLGIEPINDSIIGAHARITVRAEDNLKLSAIKLQYSITEDTWNDIATINTTNNVTFQWDTAPLTGEVKVRAIAIDSAGNISDGSVERTYIVDNQGPDKVTGLTGTPKASSVLLKWNDVPDQDFSYFQVERKDTVEGIYSSIGTVNNVLGMNVGSLKPNTTYWFRVVAYDIRGNRGTISDEIEITTISDTTAPVITSQRPRPGRFATQIPLTITASDNVSIANITIQQSTNKTDWTDITTITKDGTQAVATVAYTLDITNMQEGSCYIRGIAEDTAGNKSSTSETAPFVEYLIDHTAPVAPANIAVESTAGSITIKWDQNEEVDLSYYKIYKAENEAGPYTVLAEKHTYISYIDRDIQPSTTYYYKVAAVDIAGNIGQQANPVIGTFTEDTEAPEVLSISPNEGQMLAANPKFSVLASDNYKLAQINMYYKKDGNATDEWTLIENKNVDSYSEVVIFSWNTEGLTDGSYRISVKAIDTEGNESESFIKAYQLNLDPPSVPNVTAIPGGWKVQLTWTASPEDDLAGYRIYRKTSSEDTYRRINQTKQTSYTDEQLSPALNYYYKVQAVDIYGNEATGEVISIRPTYEDTYVPTVEAGDEYTAIIGMEVAFDGSASKDNDRIATYHWDFGDDSTASNIMKPTHIYTAEGIYTVTLTVTDPAGNTATDTTKVTVYPEQGVGKLEVLIV
ncbi:MAG: fibronectin type III domain-containing protein, partial [Clostridia bacterium]|nr:fibronectin type III domain-containing protein [Clostridia bacterium]